MDLHLREFSGTTFGMSVKASSPAFRRMKKNAYISKITPHGCNYERTVWCVKASDVAAVMGEASWLVAELKCMNTIRWGSGVEHYIIYDQ